MDVSSQSIPARPTMNEQGPCTASSQPFNRACDACRAHKVRCLPNPDGSSKTCQRCMRTDRQCIFTAPQKRRQRKRTDTRVAELEREVQAMRALFDRKPDTIEEEPADFEDQSRKPDASRSTATTSAVSSEFIGSGSSPGSKSPHDDHTPQDRSPPAFSPDTDVVEREILTMEEANQLFQSYNNDLTQYYPTVVFPPQVSAADLRRTKPTLFLAVISAAAAKVDPHLYSILNTEVLSAYAHRTVVKSEKSLELIEAMIITTVWYFPPGKYAQLKFYEYIHMAATMAMDLGLGANPKSSRRRRAGDIETDSAAASQLDEIDLEKRRTFLVCYMITTAVAASMRRINMLRFNNWMSDCVEVLGNNPNASSFDKYLIAWVKILKITEDLVTSLSLDDLSNMADLSESRVQIMITGFEKELETWKATFQPDGSNIALMLQYHHTQLYLHEIAMHDDHPPEDFMPPFQIQKIIAIQTDQQATSSYIEFTAVSISSAQSLLEILLGMDVDALRTIPIFNYVRMSYALMTLIKLYISSKSPSSRIGSVLKPETLRVDFYLRSVIDKLVEAAGPKEHRAPYTFLGMLMRFHAWYKSQEGEKHFRQPSISQNKDECWLPPVSRRVWESHLVNSGDGQRSLYGDFPDTSLQPPLGGGVDIRGTMDTEMENQIPSYPDADVTGLNCIVPGNENNMDEYMLYHGMTTTDMDFNSNWVSGTYIPGEWNDYQMPETFDWEFQTTSHTAL